MKPAAFQYLRARCAEEAVTLLAQAGTDARFLAGGQSLVPLMNFRIARPAALVDLEACADLAGVRRQGERIHIGAMTRQRDAERDPILRELCPLVCTALAHAGPLTVRNRATVGGSVANGYPLAQLPCVLAGLDAEIVLQSASGRRSVCASEFFTGAMTTSIAPGELVHEVVVPRIERYAYRESGNHAGGAAQAIACAVLRDGAVRLAVSGVEDRPIVVTPDQAARIPDLAGAMLESVRAAL